jgi:electron transfer flavoprotein beta subunit
MRIAVCIKQVPDSVSVSLDPEKHTLVRSSSGAALNPLDEFPLEAALRFKEKNGAEVTAFTMGPPKAEEILARAMAMGADNAFLLSDKHFAGSDTWATSLVLADALKKYGPFDLVLCGKQAIDGDTAQVGPEMATHLDLPQAMNVTEIDFPSEKKPKNIKVKRLFENGSDELILPLPAVMTVLKEAGEPRFGSLDGRLNYFEKGVGKIKSDDLSLSLEEMGLKGSPTRVVKTSTPSVERKLMRLDGSPKEQAQKLAAILKDKMDA